MQGLNGFLPFTARVNTSTGDHVWSQQWTSTTLGQSAGVVCASAVRQCYHAFTTASQLQLWTLDYGTHAVIESAAVSLTDSRYSSLCPALFDLAGTQTRAAHSAW